MVPIEIEENDVKLEKKRLMLFTDSFPYSQGENFLIPELPYLATMFSVTIVTIDTKGVQTKTIPEGVLVYRIPSKLSAFDRIHYLCSFFSNKVCWQELFAILKLGKNLFKRLSQSISMYSMGTKWLKALQELPEFNKQDLLYFYWYNDKLIGVASNLGKISRQQKIVTRLHGYDLYNERKDGTGRQPFKPVLDRCLNHLFFASKAGYEYYDKTFGFQDSSKYSVSRLGISNQFGVGKPEEGEKLVLVSCSNIVPLKHIELIVHALSSLNAFPISWIHFGDGPEMIHLKKIASSELGGKENITYRLAGAISNNEIHTFYQKNEIDCFITTSATEGGCPVSIQEAMSYGLAVIATEVGGIPEMMGENGILLSASPSVIEVADAISQMFTAKHSPLFQKMRNNSRRIWEREFNADVNFKQFTKQLYEL